MPEPREITYGQAILEATRQAMEEDPTVFVLGLGVDDPKGIFGTTLDLHKQFGADRSFDTPLAEDAMTGLCVGAAMAGLRPIHVHQRMDFILLAMNQLVNMAAKMRYSFAGAYKVPMVVRVVIGRSWGQGPQHSQSFHNYFMHVPGLKVMAPATPYDAKGALIAAIRDDNPVIFVEHRMLHAMKGIVPEEPYEIPFKTARLLAPGSDISLVAVSHMAVEAMRARAMLEEAGISAEVVTPVSLSPMDWDTLTDSAAKTGRLLAIDAGWLPAGASAEIVAGIAERLNGRPLSVARLGFADCPCPTTKPLENLFYPDGASIAKRAFELVRGSLQGWQPPTRTEAAEIAAFRGPF